jgi:hypothetical protein
MRNVLRRTREVNTPRSARRATTTTPLWVKVFVIIFIVLVLLIVILHLTGHGFGPHMHTSVIQYGVRHL